ncbi:MULTISPECIES: hypothetical protein [unclassified Aerococcus]|uniref:hypothetical protein n=1 Tax=unclassified Aerococcus TaxID=2618060 RepID=UPI0025C3589C|nr:MULTISPECIES: hypothetical protein [unclassified Aerococcus]
MDDLNPLLIAIVPAFLTYLGTRYKFQNEREQYASSEWKKLYEETKQQLGKNKVRMDSMQADMTELRTQMDEMKKRHANEVIKLEKINDELREENSQLRIENGSLKNQLLQKERDNEIKQQNL